jgi:hypothetical protein
VVKALKFTAILAAYIVAYYGRYVRNEYVKQGQRVGSVQKLAILAWLTLMFHNLEKHYDQYRTLRRQSHSRGRACLYAAMATIWSYALHAFASVLVLDLLRRPVHAFRSLTGKNYGKLRG